MAVFQLLLMVLLFQGVRSQGVTPGSIEGVVVDEVTGAPVSNVRVEVMGVQSGRVLTRSVRTDDKGEFRFNSLPPASAYQLVVTGEGLQPIAHGQRSWDDPWIPVTLEPGQQLRNVRIGVRLPSAIRGRVVDSRGEGLAGAAVTLMMPIYKEGRRVLEGSQSTTTNSRGEYAFSDISPGVYYVRVLPRTSDPVTRMLLSEPAELDRPVGRPVSFRNEPEGYALTYYPSSNNLESARAVTVVAGVLNNVDIRVVKIQTSRVQGSVVDDATGAPLRSGQVVLQREGSSLQSNWTRISEVRDGQFDIRAVLPGSYIVWASAAENGVRLWSRLPVDVVGGKLLQINLKASPAPVISGRIALEDRTEATDPDFTRVFVYFVPEALGPMDSTLSRLEFRVSALVATPARDGRFTLRDLPPWKHRIIVAPGAGDSSRIPGTLGRVYVKSVRNGETDIAGSGLERIDGFSGILDIVLASDSGGLDGRVLDENGQEAARTIVALVPDARQRLDLYFTTITSSTGRYQFQGVPPGSYKVFSWKNAPAGAWLDPDFLRTGEERAVPIRIEPYAAEYLEVRRN